MNTETKHTPGPWRWEVNLRSRQIKLCGGKPMFDLTVMDFVRWGMSGSQPRFLSVARPELMILEKAETFAVPAEGREHHSDWFQVLNHPDAKLITAAPDMYDLLKYFYMNEYCGTHAEEVENLLNRIDNSK